MKPKFTLRDLFWLVLVAAMGCAIAVYSSNPLARPLIEVAMQASLVVAGAVIAGKYVSRTPFSAGFVLGVGTSLLFGELYESPIRYLLRDWIMPKGINGAHHMVAVAVRASVLVHGLLGGVLAVAVSRAH